MSHREIDSLRKPYRGRRRLCRAGAADRGAKADAVARCDGGPVVAGRPAAEPRPPNRTVPAVQLPPSPTDAELTRARMFPEPLVPMPRGTTGAENHARASGSKSGSGRARWWRRCWRSWASTRRAPGGRRCYRVLVRCIERPAAFRRPSMGPRRSPWRPTTRKARWTGTDPLGATTYAPERTIVERSMPGERCSRPFHEPGAASAANVTRGGRTTTLTAARSVRCHEHHRESDDVPRVPIIG